MLLLPLSSASVAEKFQFPVSASSRVLGYAPLWVADKKGFFERQGLDYYLDQRAWEPDLGINLDGLKAVLEVYQEQAAARGPLPNPGKYLERSYLKAALKKLGWRS